MILIDGYKSFEGKSLENAISTSDQFSFENGVALFIGKDSDGDYYVFTSNHIHSIGISSEEANDIINEEPDTELIKLELIK